MGNVYISELTPNMFTGTIPASGTLSQEFDIGSYSQFGLIYSGATNGTMSFQVSAKRDADGGTYQPLNLAAGTPVIAGPTAGSGAVSSVVLQALAGYRFLKIGMSTTQAGIVTLNITAKP
jgi:hypothetical protein